MNFRGIVRDWLGGGLHKGLDHAEVLSVLVQNILVSRGPMYRIKEWAENIEPEALGLTAAQVGGLNDDRLVRSRDTLVSERGRSVFFRLALRVIKDFEVHAPRVHFGTTNGTLFGQYATSQAEPRITHGHSKDHRPNLKQLVLDLNVSSDGGRSAAAPCLQRQPDGRLRARAQRRRASGPARPHGLRLGPGAALATPRGGSSVVGSCVHPAGGSTDPGHGTTRGASNVRQSQESPLP